MWGSSYASPCARNRYPPIGDSAEFGPQPTSHTAAQASASIALNHTTPTDGSLTDRKPHGNTAPASTAATGTSTTPSLPSSRSAAVVRRDCWTSSRRASRNGATARRPASRTLPAGPRSADPDSTASNPAVTTAAKARATGRTTVVHRGAASDMGRSGHGREREFLDVGIQAGDNDPRAGELGAGQQLRKDAEQRPRRRLRSVEPSARTGEFIRRQRPYVVEPLDAAPDLAQPHQQPVIRVPVRRERRPGHSCGPRSGRRQLPQPGDRPAQGARPLHPAQRSAQVAADPLTRGPRQQFVPQPTAPRCGVVPADDSQKPSRTVQMRGTAPARRTPPGDLLALRAPQPRLSPEGQPMTGRHGEMVHLDP